MNRERVHRSGKLVSACHMEENINARIANARTAVEERRFSAA
jgi:hypothetical protein